MQLISESNHRITPQRISGRVALSSRFALEKNPKRCCCSPSALASPSEAHRHQQSGVLGPRSASSLSVSLIAGRAQEVGMLGVTTLGLNGALKEKRTTQAHSTHNRK